MKIYLEILIIFILMVIFILWRLWLLFSNWRARRNYKPENDKARKGGEQCLAAITGRKPGPEKPATVLYRLEQPEGRSLFQDNDDAKPEKVDRSNRKNSKGIGRLLRRRLKKKK